MRGIYLKCDKCGNTIGGEDVTPKQQGIPTLRPGEGAELRSRAAALGWACDQTQPRHMIGEGRDLCPKCA